jgi:hypothetical protein
VDLVVLCVQAASFRRPLFLRPEILSVKSQVSNPLFSLLEKPDVPASHGGKPTTRQKSSDETPGQS